MDPNISATILIQAVEHHIKSGHSIEKTVQESYALVDAFHAEDDRRETKKLLDLLDRGMEVMNEKIEKRELRGIIHWVGSFMEQLKRFPLPIIAMMHAMIQQWSTGKTDVNVGVDEVQQLAKILTTVREKIVAEKQP
jgi:hypothetical protein